MLELRSAVLVEDHFAEAEIDAAPALLPALDTILPPVAVAPPPNPGFELPTRLWGAMLVCYAVFFVAIFGAAGGSGHARFAIVISILYTIMFFGLARLGAKQAGPESPSPLDRGEPLMTWTGSMDSRSVFSQVLVVPIVLAMFGTGIAVIAAIAM